MLVPDGEQRLSSFTATSFTPTVTEIVPDKVFHVLGYGHSNASFIIGDQSVILIDALDTDVRGAKLAGLIAERTDKPVKTIIYTHGHPDHRGGAGAFAEFDPEVIAFGPAYPPLARTEQLADIQDKRGTRQFGYELSDEEAISQGIGIREGFTVGEGKRTPLPPTTLYREADVLRTIDGVNLRLVAAPGETEDQIFVWYEEYGVLFCGDNYYGCWPNLYAIRGGAYRDVAAWIASLDAIRSYPAESLLPGHTRPIVGRDEVARVLADFRDALDFVLSETLTRMNRGETADEIAATLQLPPRLRDLPYLQEFYGTVAWSVRSIFTGYLGWFDGNPTNLNPLAPKDRASKLIAAMGGRDEVLGALQSALQAETYQWALELADLLLTIDPGDTGVRASKARALVALGRMETSANGRHYYIASAHELLNE